MSGENSRPEATCLPAGRYEFKDSGLYIGEWLNEKAVGLGLITKDKCQGEYTGLWDAGMEKIGVFLWPNAPGAMYEGEWASNRRNGHGVFTREDWVIMGKFVDDFISLGVKCKENSIGRFEGEFENGFPSFGVETYADNGSYAGEYKNGIREGLGVRTSIPYGEVINFFPEEAALAAELVLKAKREQAIRNNELNRVTGRRSSLLSQRSGDAAELDQADDEGLGTDEEEPFTSRKPNLSANQLTGGGLRDLRMSSKFKCGFVLSSQRSELVLRRQNKLVSNAQSAGAGRKSRDVGSRSGRTRARSLTNLFNRTGSRESIYRIKRQGSSNDRSTSGAYKPIQSESVFTLDQEEAIDPETVEIYAGQWDSDTRHGYGVCERTDGVTYEGQWLKNQRHGFGQTRFRDGTCEQGRYQYGKLVFLSWSKGTKPHLLLYNYHIMREVAASVKRARVIAEQARLRATEARENLENVHIAVERSKKAAELARDYSLETRELVQEMYPDFEQPGIKYLDDMVRLMRATRRGNQVFESALEAAQEVIAGVNLAQANKAAAADAETGQDEIVEGLDNGFRRSSQNLDVRHGSPISRAGSYRNRRRSKRSRSSRGKTDSARYSPKLHNDSQMSEQIPTQNNQPLTLIVPQLTKSNMVSSSNQMKGPTYERDGPMVRGDRAQSPSDQVNGLSIPVPDTRMTLNSSGLDETDFLAPEFNEPKSCGLTRSPSVMTTYVVLPRITDLHPESEIPSVPLAKLLTNTNLMADHFDHYVRPVTSTGVSLTTATRADQTSPSYTSPPSPPSYGGLNTPGVTVSVTRTEQTNVTPSEEKPPDSTGQPGLTRRRTMPVFMTQRPAEVKFRKNLPTSNEMKHVVPSGTKYIQPNGYVQSSQLKKTTELSTDRRPALNMRIARNKILLGSASTELIAEELEELAASAAASSKDEDAETNSTIYLIEEGVRKRVHAKILPTPGPSNPPVENISELNHTDPNWDRAIVPISRDRTETDKQLVSVNVSKRMDGSPGRKPSPIATVDGSRPAVLQIPKTVPVVSNILLEDMQDQLAPLPTSFRESTINLTQPGTRYSVPNITEHLSHIIPGGLTPEELTELTQESRQKQAEELARKQQGEIVIRLYDLLDWCNRNLILIGVILLNSTLAYFFFLLTHDSNGS